MTADELMTRIREEAPKPPRPATVFPLVLEMYLTQRLAGTDLDADGDMLLFQWGTYDWGQGPHFSLDLTRQVIEGAEAEDDAIRQIRCCFLFEPSEAFDALASGNRWCRSPDEVADFAEFVIRHPALAAVAHRAPLEWELYLDGV